MIPAQVVRHNEVAPGQHEMSPIFCVANASCDSNVLFMEVCAKEGKKRGLAGTGRGNLQFSANRRRVAHAMMMITVTPVGQPRR